MGMGGALPAHAWLPRDPARSRAGAVPRRPCCWQIPLVPSCEVGCKHHVGVEEVPHVIGELVRARLTSPQVLWGAGWRAGVALQTISKIFNYFMADWLLLNML